MNADLPSTLLNEAMSLPNAARAELVDRLAASLDPATPAPADPPAVREAWRAELERRIQSYLRGEVQAVDADESADRIRARFRREFGYDL